MSGSEGTQVPSTTTSQVELVELDALAARDHKIPCRRCLRKSWCDARALCPSCQESSHG